MPRVQLVRLLEGFKVKIHVFAEDPGSGTNPPRGFGFLQDLIKGECIFVNDMDTPNTLYHFANADMVISGGGGGGGAWNSLRTIGPFAFALSKKQHPPPHTQNRKTLLFCFLHLLWKDGVVVAFLRRCTYVDKAFPCMQARTYCRFIVCVDVGV